MTARFEEPPDWCRGIPGLPSRLWVDGTWPLRPGVGIVGTRRCTSYGRRVAMSLGRAVATAGWPVISGLARGVDGAAHQGAVAAGEPGWAVLGSGIDVIYPPDHRALAEDLLRLGGGMISEYPPGTQPAPFRFPARNRIIAAVCEVVVVVEAAVTGGALITARLALELGREVLAVPGDIDRPVSEGCNLLIRDGAHPVLGASDLIESLERILGPAPQPVRPPFIDQPAASSIDELLATDNRSVGEALADLIRGQLA